MQENNLIPYRKSTELCRFMPVPKAVLDMGLSYGAVIAYGLLLDRANLSQKNSWTDERGRVYVHFATENMAQYLGQSEGSARRVMKSLEDHGLIKRVNKGFKHPNEIFLWIPTGSVDNLVETVRADMADAS